MAHRRQRKVTAAEITIKVIPIVHLVGAQVIQIKGTTGSWRKKQLPSLALFPPEFYVFPLTFLNTKYSHLLTMWVRRLTLQ